MGCHKSPALSNRHSGDGRTAKGGCRSEHSPQGECSKGSPQDRAESILIFVAQAKWIPAFAGMTILVRRALIAT
jgi:hypothetical protein